MRTRLAVLAAVMLSFGVGRWSKVTKITTYVLHPLIEAPLPPFASRAAINIGADIVPPAYVIDDYKVYVLKEKHGWTVRCVNFDVAHYLIEGHECHAAK